MAIHNSDLEIKTIYKYKEINENTLKILSDGELYFAKPSTFNDPFDVYVDYSIDASNDQKKEYFEKLQKKYPTEISIDELNDIKKNIDNNLVDFTNLAKDPYKEADLSRILCLTKSPKNILMWSHYASDHKGICIGLKAHIKYNSICLKIDNYCNYYTTPGIDEYLGAKYVEYSETKPPEYNIFTSTIDDIKPFLYTKSPLWSYEEEMRIILTEKHMKVNPIKISINEICEVIIGLNTPPDQIKIIKDILDIHKSNGIDIKLLKTRRRQGHFDLEFEEINNL